MTGEEVLDATGTNPGKERRKNEHLQSIVLMNLSMNIPLGIWQTARIKTRPTPTRLSLFQTAYVLIARTTVIGGRESQHDIVDGSVCHTHFP